MAVRSCSSCGHEELEPGFMVERNGARFGNWVRGELETGIMGNPKLLGKERFEIEAFRCTRCQHLELFTGESL